MQHKHHALCKYNINLFDILINSKCTMENVVRNRYLSKRGKTSQISSHICEYI